MSTQNRQDGFDFEIKVFTFSGPMDAGPPEEINIPVLRTNTIKDVADAFAPNEDEHIIILKNGLAIPTEEWQAVTLHENDQLVIRPSVEAGALVTAGITALGGVIMKWTLTQIFWMTVVSVAGGYLIKALTPSPKMGEIGEADFKDSQVHSRKPTSLQAEGLPIPIYFGRNRVYGNVISQYSIVDPANSEKRRINTLIGLTAGPIEEVEITDTLRIADRPCHVAQFDIEDITLTGTDPVLITVTDHTFETDDGIIIYSVTEIANLNGWYEATKVDANTFSLQHTSSINFSGVYSSGGRVGKPSSDFDAGAIYSNLGQYEQASLPGHDELRPEYIYNRLVKYLEPVEYTLPDNDYTKLKIIIAYPSGVYWLDNLGTLWPHSVGTKIEIKEVGGAYQTLLNWYASEKITNVIRLEVISSGTYLGGAPVTIETGKSYVVKVTKTTPEQSALRFGDKLVLESIQEYLEHDLSYPGLACLAVNNVDTDEIANSLDFSVIIKGNIIGHYTGATWLYGYYNNPADVLYWLAAMPVIIGDGSGTPYYVSHNRGLAENRIDLAKLLELHDYLAELVPAYDGGTEPRMTLNRGFDVRTTIWDAILEVCEVARCMPVLIGTKLSFAINKPKTPSQIFTIDNQLMKGFKRARIPSNGRVTELEIQYKDKNVDFETTTVKRQDVSAPSSAYNKATLNLTGVTSESEVWRYALNDLEQTRQQKWIIELKVDIESLACTIGDAIKVQTPVCVWGDEIRVSQVLSTTGIVVSTGLKASSADKIALRTTDIGGVEERIDVYSISGVTVAIGGEETTLVVGSAFANTPVIGDIGMFGPDSIVENNYAITRIERNSDGFATISAVDWYDDMFIDGTTTPVLTIVPDQVPITSDSTILPINWDNINNRIPSSVWAEPLNLDMPFTKGATWLDDTPAGSISWNAHTFFLNGTSYSIAASNTALAYVYLDTDISTAAYQKSASQTDIIGANKYPIAAQDSVTHIAYPLALTQPQHALTLQNGTIVASNIKASTITASLMAVDSIVADSIVASNITTIKLNDAAVITTKILDDNVTKMASSFTAGPINYTSLAITTLGAAAITLTGSPVLITAAFTHSVVNSGFTWWIYRGAAPLAAATTVTYYASDTVAYSFVEQPAAGSYTYYIYVVATVPWTINSAIWSSLAVLEVKK